VIDGCFASPCIIDCTEIQTRRIPVSGNDHVTYDSLCDLEWKKYCGGKRKDIFLRYYTLLALITFRHTQFYVLLTVHLGIIFVSNQLHAQFFFMYVYFYSPHVLGSHVPIIRRINLSIRQLVYVTLYRWPFGVQVMKKNYTSSLLFTKIWHTNLLLCNQIHTADFILKS